MNEAWEQVEVLITMRTYPVPSRQSIEASCTGVITRDGQWMRLFPVPYRLLDQEKRFHKYQWVEVRVRRARDPRPESHRLDQESIRILSKPLGTDHGWAARRRIVMPLKAESMCALQEARDRDGRPTLGFIRPKEIRRLIIRPDRAHWSDAELARLQQIPMWGRPPARELEKIPFKFSYEYRCESPTCRSHTFMCADWEMAQAYRQWSVDYGDGWEAAFRERFEREMIEEYDTHFYVGTVNDHPASWIVVGLWYPPKEQQGVLV